MSPNQAVVLHFANAPGEPAPFPSDPLASALGARLVSLDTESGSLILSFEPGPVFLQGEGVLQGGAVCAMLDFATACAAMAVLPLGQGCATMNLTTSFLRPVPPGRYHATAELEKRGRTAIFARAALTPIDQPSQLLATACAVLAVSNVNKVRDLADATAKT